MATITVRDVFKEAFAKAGVELSENKKNHVYAVFVTALEAAIKRQDSVCFTRLGTFIRKRAKKFERDGRNPRTGKSLKIRLPEREVVRFRTSRHIRKFLND